MRDLRGFFNENHADIWVFIQNHTFFNLFISYFHISIVQFYHEKNWYWLTYSRNHFKLETRQLISFCISKFAKKERNLKVICMMLLLLLVLASVIKLLLQFMLISAKRQKWRRKKKLTPNIIMNFHMTLSKESYLTSQQHIFIISYFNINISSSRS